jgi:hypothetical protein
VAVSRGRRGESDDDMTQSKDKAMAGPTQLQRRLKYGLNVLVAVAAAVVLVVLVNWIASRQYLPIDLTATRQYSLSQQTRRVLDQLGEDYRLVTLTRVRSLELQRVQDLVDLYGRYSNRVRVERIDPDHDFIRRDRFYAELMQRFDDELRPAVEAIEKGRAAMLAVAEGMGELLGPLEEMAAHPELDEQLQQFLTSLRAAVTRTQDQLTRRHADFDLALDLPLPNYAGVHAELQSVLGQLEGNLFAVAADRLQQAAGSGGAPSGVRDAALRMADAVRSLRERVRSANAALRNAPSIDRYNELMVTLSQEEAVVVVGPRQVRVLPVSQLYRQPDPAVVQQTGQAEQRFIGEERLTGTLVSMTVEQPALVVFVNSGQAPALGQGGHYEYVAHRLRAANFEVRQWNPMGQFSPMGGQTPPTDPPSPAAGQRRVWVVLPFPPVDPRNPMMAGAKPRVADAVRRGLDKGDAALFMLAADEGAVFAGEDDVVDLVKQWGITPQLDRIIFREVQLPDRRTGAGPRFEVVSWPQTLPISTALAGIPARFDLPTPLILGRVAGVTVTPIVELTERRMWADPDFAQARSAEDIRFEEAHAAERFVIGAAAERDGGGRVVVVSAGGLPQQPQFYPPWAHNQVTALSRAGAVGVEMLEVFGAAYPGNSELFVNSVFWLAGMDELIAASPRTQDIRRIDPTLSTAAVAGVQWGLLAGLPGAVVLAGLGVWALRRRV